MSALGSLYPAQILSIRSFAGAKTIGASNTNCLGSMTIIYSVFESALS